MTNLNAVSTVIGNLTADPELRYIPNSNTAVLNARIASTPRKYNKQINDWEDGEPLYLSFNAWRSLAQNVAASLRKGDRVIVVGNLTQRSYQTKDGEDRTIYEIEAVAIGPDLTFATASVVRGNAGSAPQGNGDGFGGQQGGGGYNQQSRGGYGQQGGFGGQTQGGYGSGFGQAR